MAHGSMASAQPRLVKLPGVGWTGWLVGVLWTLCLVLILSAPILHQLNRVTPYTLAFQPGQALLAAVSDSAGALILLRHPRHLVGMLFFVAAYSQALSVFLPQYAIFTLFTLPHALPLGAEAAWLNEWIWAPGFIASSSLLLLLFPDGRLPARRWRWAVWFAALATCAWIIPVAIFFWPLRGPLLIAINDGLNVQPIPDLATLGQVANGAFLLMEVSIAVAVVAVLVRYRRSDARQRLQLRWFLFATGIVGLDLLVGILAGSLPYPWLHSVGIVLDVIALPCLPIATGIAILRHRLYDIDVIINQTLVYGTLSALLVAIYLGSVVIVQSLLRLIAQQQSPLPTIASTLAIAFLFQPLRQRIQTGIDRRFYRRKYDLRQTQAAFAANLRDEVDVEQIRDQVIDVLEETLQPTSITLWLRDPVPTNIVESSAPSPPSRAP